MEESFARIRSVGIDKETIYTCYVTQNRVLLGVVTVRRMLLSSYETRIRDIMETNVLSVNTHEDKEDVAQLLNKYDLSALPVVDGDNRLVGIVTFDDAMDVIEEETTEDFEKMAAILPSDKPLPEDRRAGDLALPHPLADAADALGHLHRHHHHQL